jgi:hypothetical protein
MTASIPAWEIAKGNGDLDAGAECKRLSKAILKAQQSIGKLRDALQEPIKVYGNSYLAALRHADVGVYSLHGIDGQIQRIGEDIDFISGLLVADVGAGELARPEAATLPTRQQEQG